MKKALVNKIIPFSAVDGPGNRTSVFLQGCNINCLYCHNPETRKVCIGCGDCVAACPAGALSWNAKDGDSSVFLHYDPDKCTLCDTCIHVCTHDASPRILELTAGETFQKIAKQIPFIRGVTVSGGECTLYPDFLTELFSICREHGLDTMLDSNGTLDLKKYPELLAVTDGVMLDIKAFDEEDHRRVTGADNRQILENARYLASIGKLFEIRTVIVPGLFDGEKTVRNAAAMLKPYQEVHPIQYKIIAYRPMGVRKEYAGFPVPDEEYLKKLAEAAREEGMEKIVII
ncbi:MAG: YjjW family glycine radical enzyme activase [Lachnospiraceae bacterium]|jgi:pyruvate formate lyase activating enzyme